MAKVKIPPVLRQHTGGESEIELEGGSVGAVLESLVGQLFGEDEELNRFVNVYLNDEDVRVLDGLDTEVAESDTVMILPAMAGG